MSVVNVNFHQIYRFVVQLFSSANLFYTWECYHPGNNILELYGVLVQVQFATSKMKLDI